MTARFSYREVAVRGASPVQLVIYLYEQAIEDVRRALAALRRGDIETRTREINHALKVIAHLQGTINNEEGAEVAKNLHRFYNQLRTGLLNAQIRQSATLLEDQISLLMTVREAWTDVERLNSPAMPSPARPPSGQPLSPLSESRASEWNA